MIKIIIKIIIAIFLVSSDLPQATGLRIDFLNQFGRVVRQSSSTSSCSEIRRPKPSNWDIFNHFLGTTNRITHFKVDYCVVVFSDENCKSPVAYKYLPSDEKQENPFKDQTFSFHFCNDEDGGSQLNIDVINYYDPTKPDNIPYQFSSFKDICTCVLISSKRSTWSINNHGNDLFAYYEPNCSKEKFEPTFIPAGHNDKSWKMHLHQQTDSFTGTTYKVQSLGPDKNSTYFKNNCAPTNLIKKLELFESLQNSSQQSISYLEIDEKYDRIEFFGRTEFEDSLFEGDLSTKCCNLKDEETEPKTYDVKSIRTSRCVLLYSEFDCRGYSIRLEKGGITNLVKIWESTLSGPKTLELLYSKYPNWNWMTKSYHACNDLVGNDNQLNVDLMFFYPNTRTLLQHINDTQSYSKVCSCQNIATHLEKFPINNFGNSLVAYFAEDCSSEANPPLWIPSGVSSFSVGFGAFRRKNEEAIHRILSFGPDRNSKYYKNSCATDKIMEVELFEMSNSSRVTSVMEEVSSISTTMENEPSLSSDDIKIYFYSYPNFTGFLHESDTISTCTNLPKQHNEEWVTDQIGSIRTNVCLMIYNEHDCKGRSIKLFPELGSTNLFNDWKSTLSGPNTLAALAEAYPGYQWSTKSFHICNNEIGGPQLNLEVTEYQPHFLAYNKPNIFQSYKDLCSCRNIPKYIQNKDKWSTNNYGNSLIAYFEPNCMSEDFLPLWIPSGQSSYSMGISSFQQTSSSNGVVHNVKSFGPDINSVYFKTNCVRILTTIVKFVIIESEDEERNSTNYQEQNVEMTSSKTNFRNNAPSQFSQTFAASLSVQTSITVNTETSKNKMHRIQTSQSFDVETKKVKSESDSLSLGGEEKVGVSVKASAKFLGVGLEVTGSYSNTNSKERSNTSSVSDEAGLREGFQKAYESSGTSTTTQREQTVVENTKSFSASQTINVGPCSEQHVQAFVKMATMKREFMAVAKVTGKLGEREMTAAEVRENMDFNILTYISDFDDLTAWAYAQGNFRAEYALSSFITSEGQTLYQCVEHNRLCGSSI